MTILLFCLTLEYYIQKEKRLILTFNSKFTFGIILKKLYFLNLLNLYNYKSPTTPL